MALMIDDGRKFPAISTDCCHFFSFCCLLGGLLLILRTIFMLRGSRRLSCSCKFSYIGYWEPKIWLQPVFSMQRTNSLEKTLMLGQIEAEGKGDNRGWDSWMASLTRWTWVWASSGSWWWTGKPGVLQPMGSQRFRHDWATELNWIFSKSKCSFYHNM